MKLDAALCVTEKIWDGKLIYIIMEIQYLTINYKTLDECLDYVKRTANAGWIVLEVKFMYNVGYDSYTVNLKGYVNCANNIS